MRISNINIREKYVVPGMSEYSHEAIYDSCNEHSYTKALIPEKIEKKSVTGSSLDIVYSSAEQFVHKAIKSSDVELNLQYINTNKLCKFNKNTSQFVHKKVLVCIAKSNKYKKFGN